jgi:hypothetical protein
MSESQFNRFVLRNFPSTNFTDDKEPIIRLRIADSKGLTFDPEQTHHLLLGYEIPYTPNCGIGLALPDKLISQQITVLYPQTFTNMSKTDFQLKNLSDQIVHVKRREVVAILYIKYDAPGPLKAQLLTNILEAAQKDKDFLGITMMRV